MIELVLTPVESLEAFLEYNGEPHRDDDPADYYECTKGERLA